MSLTVIAVRSGSSRLEEEIPDVEIVEGDQKAVIPDAGDKLAGMKSFGGSLKRSRLQHWCVTTLSFCLNAVHCGV